MQTSKRFIITHTVLLMGALSSLLFFSCESKESFSFDPAYRLEFSQDTLHMDTVLSGTITSTRQIVVYNRNKKSLRINSVILAGGKHSSFRINVDGIRGEEFSDIEIAGKDSFFIFVEATAEKGNGMGATAVKDSILFRLNGNLQEVKLRMLAQNVVKWRGKEITQDTVIGNRFPIHIYDSLSITPDAHLTIEAGTQLYFHHKAGMYVHGRLTVAGTLSEPVVFRGDRTDKIFPYLPYDRLPGQWEGIRFHRESYHNRMTYADIHGSTFGIICDSSAVDRHKLTLESSVIRQVSTNALELNSCRAIIANSEISNAGMHCVSLLGGDYTFIHCTLANFFSWNTRRGVALSLSNEKNGIAYPLESAVFKNCIISGSRTDEISGQRSSNTETAFNYYFSHCLIKSVEEENERIVNVVWNGDKDFMTTDSRTQTYDFRLNKESKAINIGKREEAEAYPTDRHGNSRLSENLPDAGCYERVD